MHDFCSYPDLKKIIELAQNDEVFLLVCFSFIFFFSFYPQIYKKFKISFILQDRDQTAFLMLQVESMVLKRYGREAHRIFRLLSKSCCPLETTKVMTNYRKSSKYKKTYDGYLFTKIHALTELHYFISPLMTVVHALQQ